MSSILGWLAGGVGVIFFLLIGLVQIVVGYLGIEYHLGSGWAIGLVIASIFFRISFPLTIGTFFGALDVFGWPWFGALALAAPGLLFIVPAMITSAIANLTNSNTNRTYNNNFSFCSGYLLLHFLPRIMCCSMLHNRCHSKFRTLE